jgi:hypothetical protein
VACVEAVRKSHSMHATLTVPRAGNTCSMLWASYLVGHCEYFSRCCARTPRRSTSRCLTVDDPPRWQHGPLGLGVDMWLVVRGQSGGFRSATSRESREVPRRGALAAVGWVSGRTRRERRFEVEIKCTPSDFCRGTLLHCPEAGGSPALAP